MGSRARSSRRGVGRLGRAAAFSPGSRRPRRAGRRRPEASPRRGRARSLAAPVEVLEPVEVRRPVAQARVEVAVALALGRGAEAGDEVRVSRSHGPFSTAPVEVEAEVVQLRPRLPLDETAESKPVARNEASLTAVYPSTRPRRCPRCPRPGVDVERLHERRQTRACIHRFAEERSAGAGQVQVGRSTRHRRR